MPEIISITLAKKKAKLYIFHDICVYVLELIILFEFFAMLLNSGVSVSYSNEQIINKCKMCLGYQMGYANNHSGGATN